MDTLVVQSLCNMGYFPVPHCKIGKDQSSPTFKCHAPAGHRLFWMLRAHFERVNLRPIEAAGLDEELRDESPSLACPLILRDPTLFLRTQLSREDPTLFLQDTVQIFENPCRAMSTTHTHRYHAVI